MSWQLWTVASTFILYAVFVVIMAIVSPYYKYYLSKGSGIYINMSLLLILTVLWGVLSVKTVYCLTVSNSAKLCLSNVVVITAVIITLTVIIISLVSDSFYRKNNNSMINTEEESNDNMLDIKPEEIIPLSVILQEQSLMQ